MTRKIWGPAIGIILALALLLYVALGLFQSVEDRFDPDPVTIASASLEGLREQSRLIVFEASYNANVTTTVSKLGLTARQTLLMPGSVRYEVDMAKLSEDDVRWDAENKTLSVKMPAIEIARPEVQIENIQTYGEGGLLMALSDAENVLDKTNRRKGVQELAKQAKNPLQVKLARDAARRAVSSSFALPLRAAGLDAKVEAFFPGERGVDTKDRWDLSTPIKDVLAQQKEKSE